MTAAARDAKLDGACINTDRELWREKPGDFYSDSIHVTKDGGIGIECGGMVFVKPVREWHRIAALAEALAAPAPVASAAPTATDTEALIARLATKSIWGKFGWEPDEDAREAASMIEAQALELAELRADAARYRFLRSPLAAEGGPVQAELWQEMGVKLCREAAMDKEVDAAMRLLGVDALAGRHE